MSGVEKRQMPERCLSVDGGWSLRGVACPRCGQLAEALASARCLQDSTGGWKGSVVHRRFESPLSARSGKEVTLTNKVPTWRRQLSSYEECWPRHDVTRSDTSRLPSSWPSVRQRSVGAWRRL